MFAFLADVAMEIGSLFVQAKNTLNNRRKK